MSAGDERQVEFRTDDGIAISGDLTVPNPCAAGAVVCHPHPRYGGNRFNPVVEAVYRALPEIGLAALRFDFRPQFDDGVGERRDAMAAIEELRRSAPDVPVIAAGYSFGAMIAMAVPGADLAGRVLIAPPLGLMGSRPNGSAPTLVLTPAHDQFAPPDQARPIVESWTDADFEVISMADHFIAGQTGAVTERVVAWVSARWPPRSRP